MDETNVDREEVLRERRQLEEIDTCFQTIAKLQGLFLNGPERREDLTRAAGRRCVLGISGLKYHEYRKFFEVTDSGVKIVGASEKVNTYVEAPAESVLRVLKGVLEGDSSAFSAEWARGQARIIGERKLHDGYVFGEVFGQLARVIRRYREK